MEDVDAVVIGGGIVGASVAYHLARDDRETLLVDRGDEGRATDAGAGVLSPATSSRTASDEWFAIGVPAVEYYADLVDALQDDGVGDAGYVECGLLSVAVDEADVPAWRANERRIRKRQSSMGYPPDGTVQKLAPREAVERFPPLTEPERALYYADAARVDGRRMEQALRRAGAQHGLEPVEASADRLRLDGGAVTGVVTDSGTVATDVAVIAGGAWSGQFADQLDVSIPVQPQRGQILHVETDVDGTSDWPVVTGFEHRYLVPWQGGEVAVGATDETGVGYAAHATVAGVRELLGTVRTMAPGLETARVREIRAGLRPITPDGLPVVGPVPDVDGAWIATGHGATGLQLGPYTGKLIADAVAGRRVGIDVSPYRVGRFDGE